MGRVVSQYAMDVPAEMKRAGGISPAAWGRSENPNGKGSGALTVLARAFVERSVLRNDPIRAETLQRQLLSRSRKPGV